MLLLEDVVAEVAGRRVLDGAQLAVRRGERFAVLAAGPAERRLLIELLAGIRRPDLGRVRVDGLDPVADASELLGRIATQQPAGLDAAVLLLDVPCLADAAALDHLEVADAGAGAGPTVLLLTPSPDLARRFSDRCAVLSGGLLHPLGPARPTATPRSTP